MSGINSSARLVIDELMVPMRDGVHLATEVFRLDGVPPQPVLMIRTPYSRPASRLGNDITRLARDGWAVVIQDTRGRWDSEGDGTPFINERADGFDAVAWCAAQPWSDGRVAMTGMSYLGFTQWQAAASGAPALKAIAPLQAPVSLKDAFFHNGVFARSLAESFGAGMAGVDPAVSADDRQRLAELCADPAAVQARSLAEGPLRGIYPPVEDWLRPADDPLWSGLDVTAQTPMNVAGFHMAGWYDLFADSNLRQWKLLRDHSTSEYARASQRLIIGYWPHGYFARTTTELDFGPIPDVFSGGLGELYSWLRRALDGEPVEGGVRAFVMGSNVWRDYPDWPPPGVTTQSFYAGADGGLERSVTGAGTAVIEHRPDDPVPTCGGRLLSLWRPMPGPSDQRDVAARSDVLTYTSAPLERELTVLGEVGADVFVEADVDSADLVAKLVDVRPDGRAFNIVDGVARSTFTPGQARLVSVPIGSTAHTFRPGHRIRLQLAASDVPQHEPNPTRATLRLVLGGSTPTRLQLPVGSL